jgi:hypothetical protein
MSSYLLLHNTSNAKPNEMFDVIILSEPNPSQDYSQDLLRIYQFQACLTHGSEVDREVIMQGHKRDTVEEALTVLLIATGSKLRNTIPSAANGCNPQ